MFNSIEEMKSKGEFFKENSIIPRRILAATRRKNQERFRFGCGAWVFHTPTGYLVAGDCISTPNACAVRVLKYPTLMRPSKTSRRNPVCQGSIYVPDGESVWRGNVRTDGVSLTDSEWLENINKEWLDKQKPKTSNSQV